MDRRNFLKLTGAASISSLAIKDLLGIKFPAVNASDLSSEKYDKYKLGQRIPSICPYCAGGCGLLVTTLNGEIVEVEATGVHITYQGKPANLVIIRDISTRKQAARKMQALNERLQQEQRHRKLLSKRLIDLLEEDRRELSMELHDRTGQILAMLKMDLEIISSEPIFTGPEKSDSIKRRTPSIHSSI